MQSNLLDRIKEATTEDMLGEELGNKFPLIPPLANSSLQPGAKWLREAKPETLTQLWRRVRESITRGRTRASRAREVAQGPTPPPEACGPPQPRGGIRIVEGRGDRS